MIAAGNGRRGAFVIVFASPVGPQIFGAMGPDPVLDQLEEWLWNGCAPSSLSIWLRGLDGVSFHRGPIEAPLLPHVGWVE